METKKRWAFVLWGLGCLVFGVNMLLLPERTRGNAATAALKTSEGRSQFSFSDHLARQAGPIRNSSPSPERYVTVPWSLMKQNFTTLVMDQSLRLTPDVVTALALSQAEIELIQQGLRDYLDAVIAAEKQNLRRAEYGTRNVHIVDVAGWASSIRDALGSALAAAIGKERSDMLLEIMAQDPHLRTGKFLLYIDETFSPPQLAVTWLDTDGVPLDSSLFRLGGPERQRLKVRYGHLLSLEDTVAPH